MQKPTPPHRVRAARRSAGLTQKDLASLSGYRSDLQVSRVERGLRRPSLKFLIASTIVFGHSIEDLFKAIYDTVEEHVVREAYVLHDRLAKEDSPSAEKCRDLLTAIISAAAKRHQTHENYEKDLS